MRTCLSCRKTPGKPRIKGFCTISNRIARFIPDIRNCTLILLDINGLLMTNFTPEDLLLYLYKETSLQQTVEIEEALTKDWSLREKLAVLKASMQRLDKLVLTPRTEVVLNVLNKSREKSAE